MDAIFSTPLVTQIVVGNLFFKKLAAGNLRSQLSSQLLLYA